ncbi:hypothetical protein BJ958_001537 [Nocardioides kongjuensis]|uniref:Cobyrinic acid a,c-diamide synthase n=2 Tax=Nocardioides kongjuensis TaxID=349522 RepID=A0A852R8S2_9ACTN|nr:hypothetical protein [Nocardioides kongjuensis]
MSMPAADDLFRPTAESSGPAVRAVPDPPAVVAQKPQKGPTGRVRHEEKITVYVSSAELMELEKARLTLRGEHGMAVDRGRLVREALHLVLGELEAEGEGSALVRRLRES